MKHREQLLALSVVAVLALIGFFTAGMAWGQTAPTFTVGPFVDANTPGAPEMSLLITNTGEFGDLCANIYTHAPDGQMTNCCFCPVKANGLVILSVNDLTGNTATGTPPPNGVIKIVGGNCFPQNPYVYAGMKTYNQTRQNPNTSFGSFAVSPPIPVPDSPLGAQELRDLGKVCTFGGRGGYVGWGGKCPSCP